MAFSVEKQNCNQQGMERQYPDKRQQIGPLDVLITGVGTGCVVCVFPNRYIELTCPPNKSVVLAPLLPYPNRFSKPSLGTQQPVPNPVTEVTLSQGKLKKPS